MPDAREQDMVLLINGTDYVGWYEQSFKRTMEDICGSFSLSVLHDVDGSLARYRVIKEGDKCELLLAGQALLTGYVEESNPFYSRKDIGRSISGRDITCDVVDCSARYQGGEWINANFMRIASDVCSTVGIKVMLDAGVSVGAPFPKFRIETGETIGAVLARAAGYRGLMLFTTAEGHLMVSQASSQRASSMLRRGDNIIDARRQGGVQNLFNTYRVEGQADANDFGLDATRLAGMAVDPLIRKSRSIIIPAETGTDGGAYKKRADFTVKQRRGAAWSYNYTVDNWFQGDGRPWNINEVVTVDDPELDLAMVELLVAGVEYRANRSDGKTAVLTLKPESAFDSLPVPDKSEGAL